MPVTPTELAEYARRMKQLQRDAMFIDNATRHEVEALISEYKNKIHSIIRAHIPRDAVMLPITDSPAISRAIGGQVDEMIVRLQGIVSEAQLREWSAGLRAGQKTGQILGAESAFFHPTPELIQLATRHTADLIRTIGPEFMKKVDGTLARGILGRATPWKVMREIDDIVGNVGKTKTGVSYQAERIVRTEVNRVYSIALDTQVQSFAQDLPAAAQQAVKKEWVSGPYRMGRRESHQKLSNLPPIPVNEKFANGLMYPRDPGGLAREVINCGCSWRLVPESIEEALELMPIIS